MSKPFLCSKFDKFYSRILYVKIITRVHKNSKKCTKIPFLNNCCMQQLFCRQTWLILSFFLMKLLRKKKDWHLIELRRKSQNKWEKAFYQKFFETSWKKDFSRKTYPSTYSPLQNKLTFLICSGFFYVAQKILFFVVVL